MNSSSKTPRSVGVLGLGNWGTALANHLACAGHDVIGWTIQDEIVHGINSEHRNPCYQSEVVLSSELRATADLSELSDVEYLLLVVPSKALQEVLSSLTLKKDVTLISAVKGLGGEENLTPLELCKKYLPEVKRLAVFSGPSYAADIVAGKPAGVVTASDSKQVAEDVARLLTANRLRVYVSSDTVGVELGGIVKNIIAVAAGVCDGLDLGASARAGLITRGLAELIRFATASGARAETLTGLSGLGDLIVTTTDDQSRNRRVGLALGRGEKLDDILTRLGSVAEGVRTAPIILGLAKELGVDMPITEAVTRLLAGELSPSELIPFLIERPIKPESSGNVW